MIHVADVSRMVEKGDYSQAEEALEQLLLIAPKNVNALKILCQLYAIRGEFNEEARIWQKILDLDVDDEDAQDFFEQRYLEERESFYFTDQLPDGGRRFLAYPKGLIQTALFGLLGCVIFLLFSHYSAYFPFLLSGYLYFVPFFLLVVIPWVCVFAVYLKGLREVLVGPGGICFYTHLKKHDIPWSSLDRICLSHRRNNYKSLVIIFRLKNSDSFDFELDLSDDDSSIRARSFFLVEIRNFFGEPEYLSREDLLKSRRKTIFF